MSMGLAASDRLICQKEIQILLQCFNYFSLAGVSRSTTVVVAYLMTLSGLPWKDCLAAVQSARPCASPNFGFQRQLLEFQYENVPEV